MKKGQKYQFAKSSGLFPLTSNPSAASFDKNFLCVFVPSQGWMLGWCGKGYYPSLLDSFGRSWLRVFESRFSLV
jgi:hypothetical protein